MKEKEPLDLTPIRARLERFDPAYNSQHRDVAALVAEVDRLRARLASLVQGITALRDQWRSEAAREQRVSFCADDLDRLLAEQP